MNNTTTDSKGEEEESRGDPPVEDPPAGKDPPEEEEKEGGSKEPESSDHGPPARSSSEQDAQNKTTEVDAKEDQEKGNETSTPNPEEKADTKIGSNEDSSLAEKKEPSESDIISVKPEENKNSDDVEMVDVEKEKAIVDSEEKTEKKDIHDVEMKDAPASPKPNPNQQPSARTEDTAPETNPQSNTNNNHNHDNETQQREPITMNIIPEENEDDQYDFPESFPVKRKTKPSTRTAAKHKKLKISIRSVSPEQPPATKSSMEQQVQSSDDKKQEPQSHVVPDLLREYRSIGEDMLWPEDNGSAQQELDAELEDSLLFFQDTHEEQDPAYINFIQEREEHALKQKLQQLEAEDAVGRKEIDEAITAQSKDKQILTNRNIEKYQLKAASEEKRDTQRLMQLYNEKVTSNQGRIDQGIKILTRRHQQEMQNAMNQHRQQFQNQQQSLQAQQQWASVAQQLQGKHQRQMNEFQAKGEEMKKKSEKDFQAQQEKLKNQYQMRLREIEASRRKVFAKIFNGFQQLRQRYLKRHSQKIAKKREMILQHSKMVKQQLQKAAGKAPEEVESSEKKRKKKGEESSSEEKQEFMRPPSPVKTSLDWIKEELLVKPDGELSGGSIRHKQRKSVLSQLGKQLSVEIHNEGLWISTFADKSKEGDTNTEDASNRSNGTRNSGKGTSGAANSSSAKPGESGDKNDSKGSETEQEKFIPWGVEAHTILQSIICGEIPRGYHFAERGTDFGDALSVQGGHIRCVVTDLRTNESTASSQRAASIHEQEESNLQGLEQKIVELSSLANEAEATLSRAEAEEKECRAAAEKTASDYEKAKKIQQEFRTKFSGYLGPDGNPLPTTNPNDHQELTKAIARYKSNIDTAESRNKAARASLNEARSRTQKMQAVAKHAQKAVTVATGLLKKKKAMNESKGRGGKPVDNVELERAAGRVKDVIVAFRKTAEKRRDQLNQKRNSSASSTWVQSLPGLPGPLKKSLWHKMHRRRQQIVLRPSLESLTAELRSTVEATLKAALQSGKKRSSKFIEEEVLRAEQSLYLAMHPAAPKEALPSVPPSGSSSDKWAEPGWQLNLDVPSRETDSSRILPCSPAFPVLSKNLAELNSAPGRQAAAFNRTSHLRCLESNLSAVATATSLAETNPSVSSELSLSDGDPLNISPDALKIGYTFYLAAPPKQSSSNQRRKSSVSTNKESTTAAATAAAAAAAESTKKQLEATRTASSSSMSESAKKAAEAKKRRTSKSTPSPRVTKRKPTTTSENKNRSSIATAQAPQPALVARAPSASSAPPYNRQQNTPNPAAGAAAAAAQYNQYMKHQSQPQPQQGQQPNYQLMQQQQQQQQQPPPQHQYGSPQQRQIAAQQQAQLRMMQQQQQNASRGQPMPAGYPPQQQRPGMPQQFFNPMRPAPGGQPQYQMPPMQGMPQGMQMMGQPMQPPNIGVPPQQQQQQQQQRQQQPPQQQKRGGMDDQNDPLFMLK